LDRIASLQEALDLVEALEEDPIPPYSRQLAEADNLWCFDFGGGEYRVVYRGAMSIGAKASTERSPA
jgi:hypothetical protein